MGCDYFADENGEFVLRFQNKDGEVIGDVIESGMEAGECIYCVMEKGNVR